MVRQLSRRASLVSTLAGLVMVVSSATADQTAAELPALFDQLRNAENQSAASVLESRIWRLWLEAPDDGAAALMSQLTLAMQAGELDLALALSNQLIDSNPEFSEAWNKRATVHYLMGNSDASVNDIRETLVLEPRHFGAISGLGLIFMRQGNFAAALQAFERVLAITPASSNAQRSAQRMRDEIGKKI